jgi:hypothetical protein
MYSCSWREISLCDLCIDKLKSRRLQLFVYVEIFFVKTLTHIIVCFRRLLFSSHRSPYQKRYRYGTRVGAIHVFLVPCKYSATKPGPSFNRCVSHISVNASDEQKIIPFLNLIKHIRKLSHLKSGHNHCPQYFFN